MKKICYIATIPAVIQTFLRGYINQAGEKYEITVVCNSSNVHLLNGLNIRLIVLPIERKISLWHDLLVLIRLVMLFHQERFDLVHSIMPKTGLLTALAGGIARTPYRLHTFTGQVWATKHGWKRRILKTFDKVIAQLATHVLVDSPSQRTFLVSEGILSKNQGIVLGQGSICGVDSNIFKPNDKIRAQVREKLNISPSQLVILFLGRLNRDKGILDLASAFAKIAERHSEAALVLVGAEEDVTFAQILDICGKYQTQLRKVSFTPHPEYYMAMADIFCLPSYREGFGQVIIEAAATRVPTVATKIYGITDAVADKETGILYPPGDVDALARTLSHLLENPDYRLKLGHSAQTRALSQFSSRRICTEMISLYSQLLACEERTLSKVE
jgi:glycosyltransferase involved in cell wall biosynthesis